MIPGRRNEMEILSEFFMFLFFSIVLVGISVFGLSKIRGSRRGGFIIFPVSVLSGIGLILGIRCFIPLHGMLTDMIPYSEFLASGVFVVLAGLMFLFILGLARREGGIVMGSLFLFALCLVILWVLSCSRSQIEAILWRIK